MTLTKEQREHEGRMQVGWVLACLMDKGVDPLPKIIRLTQGQWALVDEEDYERLNEHKWCAVWVPAMKAFYASRGCWINQKVRHLKMHRTVLGLSLSDPLHVDHLNGTTLDNRRANLKACTHRENHENRRKKPKYGVGVRQMRDKFQAYCTVKGKQKCLGSYATPEEAQAVRNEYVKTLSKDF